MEALMDAFGWSLLVLSARLGRDAVAVDHIDFAIWRVGLAGPCLARLIEQLRAAAARKGVQ
jgi:hypothetical protein